jgi:type VI protein secretion system component VasF
MMQAAPDQWTARLKWVAIGCVCLALLLFVFYKISLSSSASELNNVAAQVGK